MATFIEAPGDQLLYNILGVKIYHNGTVDRSEHLELLKHVPADPQQPTHGALSRDVVASSPNLWVRIYVPVEPALVESANASEEGKEPIMKLPIILYFHGGGFVLCSAATDIFHAYCCKVSAKIRAVVVSVEYRLAPEHKLPAAFDDGLTALNWLRRQAIMQHNMNVTKQRVDDRPDFMSDTWLSEYGDFNNCFIMGHSAGATIVHQTALRALSGDGFDPLKIRGLIFGVPYFGGTERTRSEVEYGDNDFLPMSVSDACWAVAAPEGADRSHPYFTFRTPEMQALLKEQRLPPSLVVVGAQDPLHDRQIEYAEFLREFKCEVKLLEYGEYGHRLFYPEMSREEDVGEAYSSFKDFMAKCLGK